MRDTRCRKQDTGCEKEKSQMRDLTTISSDTACERDERRREERINERKGEMKKAIVSGMMVLVVVAVSGCSAFRISVKEKDPAEKDFLSAKYDHNDLIEWGKLISQDLVNHPFPEQGQAKPRIVPMGIQNRTRSHLDMKAISDTITSKLLDTQKIRLIGSARRDDMLKEQGYQLANCTASTRAAIGKQLGANYMMTGSLVEIGQKSGREVRASRKEDVYYQLTVEITDLTSGEIVVRKQRDRLRRQSRPIIGW